MGVERWWNDSEKRNQRSWRDICSIGTLSTMYLTRNGSGLNPGG